MTEPSIHRVIAGFGRSGTTWVQDVLAKANSLRTVFEPLHPQEIAGADVFANRCIPETRKEPELYRLLHRYFCENYHSLWVDYRIEKGDLVPRGGDLTSRAGFKHLFRNYRGFKDNYLRFHKQRRHPQRLIKLIRANLMLPWLRSNFGARIVFVIRHPAAVVLSRMTAPHIWDPCWYIDRYRQDPELPHVLEHRTRNMLFQPVEDVEAHTLCWCIENTIALQQEQRYGTPIVHYELLLKRGLPEWQRMVSALELKHMPDEQLVSQPSQQTWGPKATNSTLLRNYASWMEDIDKSVSVRIQRVLDATGMNIYSVDNPLPVSRSNSGS